MFHFVAVPAFLFLALIYATSAHPQTAPTRCFDFANLPYADERDATVALHSCHPPGSPIDPIIAHLKEATALSPDPMKEAHVVWDIPASSLNLTGSSSYDFYTFRKKLQSGKHSAIWSVQIFAASDTNTVADGGSWVFLHFPGPNFPARNVPFRFENLLREDIDTRFAELFSDKLSVFRILSVAGATYLGGSETEAATNITETDLMFRYDKLVDPDTAQKLDIKITVTIGADGLYKAWNITPAE